MLVDFHHIALGTYRTRCTHTPPLSGHLEDTGGPGNVPTGAQRVQQAHHDGSQKQGRQPLAVLMAFPFFVPPLSVVLRNPSLEFFIARSPLLGL